MNKSELIAKVALSLDIESDEVRLVFEKIVDEMRGKKPAGKPDKKEQKEAKNKE